MEKGYECKLCSDSGFVLLKDEKGRSWATACDCKKGDNKLYDGRTIEDPKRRSPYFIPRYSQVMKQEVKRQDEKVEYIQTEF